MNADSEYWFLTKSFVHSSVRVASVLNFSFSVQLYVMVWNFGILNEIYKAHEPK